jgi:hypothetical protein
MKILTLIAILLSTICSFGQSGDYCGKKKKLTIPQIKKKFPFDRTQTIKLVSFKHKYSVTEESDTVEAPTSRAEIPKTGGKVDLTKMFETKTLDSRLTEKILDVLVNYDNENRESESASCYEPRNGIIFMDKDEKILGFVEICFDCLRYEVEPSNLTVKNFCLEKFDVLKSIFKESGIVYGTVLSED